MNSDRADMMGFLPRLMILAATGGCIFAASSSLTWAQTSPTEPSSNGARERLDSFGRDASGFMGRLFGGSRRAQPTPSQDAQTSEADEANVQVAQMSSTDLVVRLERLENQIRQLTGALEQLQYRNQQLEQQIRRSQEDADFRFQELGSRGSRQGAVAQPPGRQAQPGAQPMGAPTAAPSALPLPSPPGGRRSDVFDPQQSPDAPGAPRTLGAISQGAQPGPIMQSETDPPPVGAPGGRGAGEPLDLGTLTARAASDPSLASGSPPRAQTGSQALNGGLPPPPPRNPNATGVRPQQTVMAPSATPKDEYDLAYGYILRKDYALAEENFRAFLQKHPGDALTSDATYWLGESLFQRQRYRDAAEFFLNVTTNYKSSKTAPDSLLRLGQSLAALKEKDAACATLAEIGRKYPRASPTVRQHAEREQKRVGCS